MYSPPMQLCYAILPSDLNMDMITENRYKCTKAQRSLSLCRFKTIKIGMKLLQRLITM